MKFIVSASTDVGTVKETNQDCMNVLLMETSGMQLVLAILCDGMGGLQKGELASASVLYAFRRWKEKRLFELITEGISDGAIRREWTNLILECNEKIKDYGRKNNVSLGTTVTVMLLTPNRYYIANVGDSRAYEIGSSVIQLTRDHSLVAREVELGRLAAELAEADPRQNVLLQCVGATEDVNVDFFFGKPQVNTVFMLCSDGFRHKITSEEMYAFLAPAVMNSGEQMRANEMSLIQLVKDRGERDNITVVTIRTYAEE